MKTCPKCGILKPNTSDFFHSNGDGLRSDCKNCHNRITVKYVQAWRTRTKRKIVELLGGACSMCGYKKSLSALQCHHINPKTKEATIADMMVSPRKWDNIKKEIDKCILLCSNCHAETHNYIPL